MMPIKDSHIAILQRHNSSCSWCILEQCHLPEATPGSEPLLVNKPLLLDLFDIALTDSSIFILFTLMEFLLQNHLI